MNTDQEAEQLARKIHEKYRHGIGGGMTFDQLLPTHRQGWIDSAKLFLEEQDAAKDLLVQAVAEQCKFAEQFRERAEKAESELAKYHDVAKHRDEVMERLTNERDEAVVKAYALTQERERDAALACTREQPEGIEGTLIQAGTLTDGAEVFSGIVLSVPWEALRDAKRMPFYSKVRVVEVA